MNKLFAYFFGLVVVLTFGYFLYASFLTPSSSAALERPTLNWASQVNPDHCIGKIGSPVLDITFKVTNDVDSGTKGNWALDDNNKQIQVWRTGDDLYCAVVRYQGQFQAQEGRPSPGGTGVISEDFRGTFQGGYVGILDGKFTPGTSQVKGNLGTKDYGCNIAGTCGPKFDWVGTYFKDAEFDFQWWGWIYSGGRHGAWVNSQDGNKGDLN